MVRSIPSATSNCRNCSRPFVPTRFSFQHSRTSGRLLGLPPRLHGKRKCGLPTILRTWSISTETSSLDLTRHKFVKVRESFALRAESKRLLDLAKHAVEVAIEQGEERRLRHMNKQKLQSAIAAFVKAKKANGAYHNDSWAESKVYCLLGYRGNVRR